LGDSNLAHASCNRALAKRELHHAPLEILDFFQQQIEAGRDG
jgi:hypothetical protein